MTVSSPATSENRYRVGGMDCASCASKIEAAVRSLPDVTEVTVSAASGTMVVRHAPGADIAAGIADRITKLGYALAPAASAAAVSSVEARPHEKRADSTVPGPHGDGHGPTTGNWWESSKGRLAIGCGVALVAAWLIGRIMTATQPWGFIIAMAIGLVPIARRAFVAARMGMPFTIETLMTIAAIGAVLINAAEEAAAVVFLFLVGELLEGIAAERARSSITGLTQLVPKTAFVETDGKTREVAAESLAIGASILVRPGDRIPADGDILSGESAIDEAPVTGESVPKRKRAGDRVFAGTINQDAALRVRVTAIAVDNTIARIVKLVEEAQEAKAPTGRFIDRFSKYYTPGVLALGTLVAILPPILFDASWSAWIYKGLAILLIGCPCALVISVPAAIAAGLSNGARRGLLMKGGGVLEGLGKITTAAFDKTGTLTEGKPQVTDVLAFGRGEREILRLAAALEVGSSHPLARAILARAAGEGITAKAAANASTLSGKGVVGTVDGIEVLFGSARAANERAKLSAEQQATIDRLNGEGKTASVLVAEMIS